MSETLQVKEVISWRLLLINTWKILSITWTGPVSIVIVTARKAEAENFDFFADWTLAYDYRAGALQGYTDAFMQEKAHLKSGPWWDLFLLSMQPAGWAARRDRFVHSIETFEIINWYFWYPPGNIATCFCIAACFSFCLRTRQASARSKPKK